jgi:hypothetical protein
MRGKSKGKEEEFVMKKNILIDMLTDYLALVMVVGCIYAIVKRSIIMISILAFILVNLFLVHHYR